MPDDQKANTNTEEQGPAPEVLRPQGEAAPETPSDPPATDSKPPASRFKSRRGTYRPSHRATFIGLAVVVVILAVNAALIGFVLKKQSADDNTKLNTETVTISQSALEKLGVDRNTTATSGIELVVGPKARFNSAVQIGGDVSVAGQLKLNSKFSASEASLTKLDAGDTSISKLNVNGDATVTNLGLRNDLSVAGAAKFQGAVVMSQLFTVNNNVNIAGSVSIGGVLTVNSFHAASLVVDSSLTVGGHIISRGSAPSVSKGSAVGSNGTVSISGNDTSGTVIVNTGVGTSSGLLATVTFRNKYSNTPHVVVTPVGATNNVYISRNSTGFSIWVNSTPSLGGHAFDYIVMQ
jgi:hypothetical protein